MPRLLQQMGYVPAAVPEWVLRGAEYGIAMGLMSSFGVTRLVRSTASNVPMSFWFTQMGIGIGSVFLIDGVYAPMFLYAPPPPTAEVQ